MLCLLVVCVLLSPLPVAWARVESCASYSQAHPLCTVRGDCLGLDCTVPGGAGGGGGENWTASLTVSNCQDPVLVHLSLTSTSGGVCQKTLRVGKFGQYMGSITLDQGKPTPITINYFRNTSHLLLDVIAVTDNVINNFTTLVPEVWFPLRPDSCMCNSLHNLSDAFSFPLPETSTSCAANDPDRGSGGSSTGGCTGFHCNITYADLTMSGHFNVDPCAESLSVRMVEPSTGVEVYSHVFMRSETLNPTLGPVNPTVYVVINHYSYSMEVAVLVDLGYNFNITLISPQRIILDRSSCANLPPFPADSHSDATPSQWTCSGTGTDSPHTGPPNSQPTPPPSSRKSIVAVAVAVPITVIMLLIIVAAVVVTLVLLWMRSRRRRDISFRRIAFDEEEDEAD